jgi:aspartyl-tRNA(Asn)/glutamyl-tRNA(Gln) amidotransferase subunit A
MTADPCAMSLIEVADAIRARRLSSLEVTRACLARIERLDERLNCFIALEAEAALGEAAARDAELARGNLRGALHGVPLAHKDMFYRPGAVSTGGSEIRRNWRAERHATVLRRLEAAGAVNLGRLNMSEFAAGPTGHNKFYGACRNPWNPRHMTGGSSSGSGAAVAARLVYGALGSDTGGSIRMPASANGVVGLKPTYGRVSRFGAMPRAWSLDHVGPLARSAGDCALLSGIIAGADPQDPSASAAPVPDYLASLAAGIKGWRVGVPHEEGYAGVAPEVRDSLAASLEVLRSLGARLVPVRLPDLSLAYQVADTIIKCEAATIHRRWLGERSQDYSDHVRSRIEAGLLIPATRYIEALSLRATLLADFLAQVMAEIDVLHLPALPLPVPTLAESDVEGTGEAVLALVAQLSRFTRPFNLLGLPALSVPCGFSASGLPLGCQLVGKPFAEAALFTVAHSYQQATDFHIKSPRL